MVRFNIIGYGFLDIADPTGVAFKTENHQFRFCGISLGRSVEFSVPATDRNREMLGYGEDPAETGEMLRRNYPCQLVYDGGMKMGTIAVTAYESEAFKCVFTIGNAEWIETLQNKKLSECVVTGDKGTVWNSSGPTYDANVADPTQLSLIVRYENDYTGSHWSLVPSLSVQAYLENIFTNLGIPFVYDAPQGYWLITASMKGGTLDTVTLDQVSTSSFVVTQLQNYIDIADIDIEWGTAVLFGAIVGGGSSSSKGFKALEDVKVTFPNTLPTNLYLIKWDSRLTRCKTLGCTFTDPYGVLDNINGMTLDIKKGDVFFLSDRGAPDVWQGILPYYGFKASDVASLSLSSVIERNGDLNYGETWFVHNNHPDMTVFEFLKSVALATGCELYVDGEEGVIIGAGKYGNSSDYFKALERVVSVDSVTRRVRCWGDGTRKATIAFDSEPYVTEPIRSTYDVQNDQQKEEREEKIAFSEGSVGTNGVLVRDVEAGTKFVAKKWTLAYADASSAYLQRVAIPSPVGYYDIANNATALEVRIASEVADFFSLDPACVYTWRGVAYVWTDASWSDGIMTLTLQRVSELNQDENDTPQPPQPVLQRIDAVFSQPLSPVVGTDDINGLKQYLVVTAVYSDNTTRVLNANEYSLSGILAYPNATVQVRFEDKTDTFTVDVAYDAQVEYLESKGTQYIDTGVAASTEASYEVECAFTNKTNQFMGAIKKSGSTTYYRSCFGVYGDKIAIYYGRLGANLWNPQSYDSDFHNYKQVCDGSSVFVEFDGVSHSFTIQHSALDMSYYLFNRNSNDSSLQLSCEAKVRFAKFYDSAGSLVLDLIPVRCGTTGYMYDRVSGRLFGNDGTGDFIVGSDV